MALRQRRVIHYGNAPVPYTTGWSGEAEPYFIDRCPHARMPALCQPSARGEGRPVFGEQHFPRQRETIVRGLCDLCARPLAAATKVSLSDARPQEGAAGWAIMQFEPLLHRECAAFSVRHCPWLRGRIASGEMLVRHVTRWRAQISILDSAAVAEHVPGYTGADIAGYALAELRAWKDRDMKWLGSARR